MMFGYFAGYLGSEPEERMTSKGRRVVVLRLAVRGRNGSKDETFWCKCNIWNDRYDKMIPYLRKGSAVIVAGEIAVESYMGRDGTPQSSIVVSVDSLKFSPFGRSESRESGTPATDTSVAMGFEGEALDAEAVSDKDMYAGSQDQDYVCEDVPF